MTAYDLSGVLLLFFFYALVCWFLAGLYLMVKDLKGGHKSKKPKKFKVEKRTNKNRRRNQGASITED